MKWFKHYSSSHDDPRLAEILFRQDGLSLFGFYWLIVEVIAGQYDDEESTSLEYSARKWSSFAGISPKKFQKFAETLGELGLFSVEISGKNLRIGCSNIKKIKDEYSRKKRKTGPLNNLQNIRRNSGETPDTVRPKEENRREQNRIEESIVIPKKDKSLKAINDEMIDDLQRANPEIAVRLEFEKFKDYLRARGKSYKDYPAAFRNWIRSNYVPRNYNGKPISQTEKTKVVMCRNCGGTAEKSITDTKMQECPICTDDIWILESADFILSEMKYPLPVGVDNAGN